MWAIRLSDIGGTKDATNYNYSFISSGENIIVLEKEVQVTILKIEEMIEKNEAFQIRYLESIKAMAIIIYDINDLEKGNFKVKNTIKIAV